MSVIIPTFNRAAAACRAVQSVLDQTYTSLEIIVINDGSTDDTLARLAQFGDSIRVVTVSNGGAAAARNRGIEASHGELIAFLDSDDTWRRDKLEMQLHALAMLGSDYGACFSDCRYIGDARLRASSFEEAGLTSETTFAPLDSPLQWILGRFTPIYIQSLLVRRTVATELGGLDERLTVGEDTDFFFRMAVRTKLCFVREALVEIDRTPTRPFGLMELFREGSDRMFSSQTLMFRKWLSAGCSDRLVHQQIEAFLRDALYEWTVSSLYRGALRHAIDHVREIRATGAGPLEIARTLSRRTLRKGASAVLGRT